MKRKLKIKKTVVRSLTRKQVSGAAWGGWNCSVTCDGCYLCTDEETSCGCSPKYPSDGCPTIENTNCIDCAAN
jgi:hypothetical protein